MGCRWAKRRLLGSDSPLPTMGHLSQVGRVRRTEIRFRIYSFGAGEKVCGRRLLFQGSGRTDAGGARNRTSCPCRYSPAQQYGSEANGRQPLIPNCHQASGWFRQLRANEVFHAQHSALEKSYRYRIAQGPVLMPQLHQRAWHLSMTSLTFTSCRTPQPCWKGITIFSASRSPAEKTARAAARTPDDTRRTLSSVILTRHSLAEHADTSVIDLEFTGTRIPIQDGAHAHRRHCARRPRENRPP